MNQNKKHIASIDEPSFFSPRKNKFKWLLRTKVNFKTMFHELSISDITFGYLTNTILSNHEIDKMLSRHKLARTAIRTLTAIDGDINDPTFDWIHFYNRGFSIQNVHFKTETTVLKGNKKRLRGLSMITPKGLNENRSLLVETFHFTDKDLSILEDKESSETFRKLPYAIGNEINELINSLNILRGGPFINPLHSFHSDTIIQTISYHPFDIVNIAARVDQDGPFEIEREPSANNLNTYELLEQLSQGVMSGYAFSIAGKVTEAIRLRNNGNLSLSPILIHTAVENMITVLQNEYGFILPAQDKFKRKLFKLSKMLGGTKDLMSLQQLYAQYVYAIRSNCAHTQTGISPFLANYCIIIGINLLMELVNSVNKIKTEKPLIIPMPYKRTSRQDIAKMTKELRLVYGDQLVRLQVFYEDSI